jgi:extradiol dioxygenase family protein
MPELFRFHLAMPDHDSTAASSFFRELLGCPEGRSVNHWVDFDLFGHQFVARLAPTLLSHYRRDVACRSVLLRDHQEVRHGHRVYQEARHGPQVVEPRRRSSSGP